MLGRVEGEVGYVVWIHAVSNETAGGVGVEPNHEEECLGPSDQSQSTDRSCRTHQVMSVPERFEALLTDLLVGGRVHEQHDQEHPAVIGISDAELWIGWSGTYT